MIDPIVFISRNRVKEGMGDAFRHHYRASIAPIEDGKPGTLVQFAYESEDTGEIVVVRVFPNADAMDQQLLGADDRSKKTYEFIEPVAVEIYGSPGSFTLEMMKRVAGSGLPVTIYPHSLGGFMRLKPV